MPENEETAVERLRDATANGQVHPAILPAVEEVGGGDQGDELEARLSAVERDVALALSRTEPQPPEETRPVDDTPAITPAAKGARK
jgi:hypothetical protein